MQYVPHLDQLWVTCDTSANGKYGADRYVVMVIRAASDVSGPHQVIHTEPVGGNYDMVSETLSWLCLYCLRTARTCLLQ